MLASGKDFEVSFALFTYNLHPDICGMCFDYVCRQFRQIWGVYFYAFFYDNYCLL